MDRRNPEAVVAMGLRGVRRTSLRRIDVCAPRKRQRALLQSLRAKAPRNSHCTPTPCGTFPPRLPTYRDEARTVARRSLTDRPSAVSARHSRTVRRISACRAVAETCLSPVACAGALASVPAFRSEAKTAKEHLVKREHMRIVGSVMLIVFFLVAGRISAAEATKKQSPQVARGKYLVTIMACNDCHTPLKMGPKGPEPGMTRMLSGHPQEMKLPPPPAPAGPWIWSGTGTLTAFAGPWGISYAINLTPDQNTGIGIWTEE